MTDKKADEILRLLKQMDENWNQRFDEQDKKWHKRFDDTNSQSKPYE